MSRRVSSVYEDRECWGSLPWTEAVKKNCQKQGVGLMGEEPKLGQEVFFYKDKITGQISADTGTDGTKKYWHLSLKKWLNL